MKILIAGASGLVGTAVADALRKDGHIVGQFVRPSKTARPGDVSWDPASGTADLAAMEGADAVICLSGASVGEGRWTAARKSLLRSSRVDLTRVMVDSLGRLNRKPRVFVAASAIGYYGSRGDEILTESSTAGNDFISLLARDWETESTRAEVAGIRTVILRFAVVLSAKGGALARMVLPFKLGAGGRLGSGKQWMSWVALEDVVEIIRAAISDERIRGPVNVAAPGPVQNVEFTGVLARVLHRPAIFPAPAFALRIALGEMADGLLLASQRVIPEKLRDAGYKFRYENLEAALRTILAPRA
ncbi:MAG TPA: TIGR01777 family oxidoreductase [Candidatus Limnocylindria bacterium]|nr:TIGR01777 family oxidoreductase [Candidatus Limnocylindria bacterium]